MITVHDVIAANDKSRLLKGLDTPATDPPGTIYNYYSNYSSTCIVLTSTYYM